MGKLVTEIKETNDELEQLMTLRDITRRTGILHEVQIIQLKHYPIVMTHAIKCNIEFDFDKLKVIFDLIEVKGKTPLNIKKRLNVLNKSTKMLLGDEYTIIVKLKGEEIFRSLGTLRAKKSRKNKSK